MSGLPNGAPLTIYVTADHRQAVLGHDGRMFGSVFTSISLDRYYIDANTVVHWFLYGAALHALDPAGMSKGEFSRVKEATYKLLVEAARSAIRCGLTAPQYAAFFLEAALRGQLPNYESALMSLVDKYRYEAAEAADQLNPRLQEWCWIIQATQTEIYQAGQRERANPEKV